LASVGTLLARDRAISCRAACAASRARLGFAQKKVFKDELRFAGRKRSSAAGACERTVRRRAQPIKVYAETGRIVHGQCEAPFTGTLHSGYIEERPVNARGTLVVVTAAGPRALRNRS
jgi:hypothetical protein